MMIRIEENGTRIVALLENNATAEDFSSLLPLRLTLDDSNGTEQISDLPKKLSTRGAPQRVAPKAGDLAYYAPWGSLAIFYNDFAYSRGLVKFGTVESSSKRSREASG
jgi:hypothetical protein